MLSDSGNPPEAASPRTTAEGSIIETIQSLIVAFVLAMTFRGFVVEGFVIPTGSMAPTLMGQHLRIQSPQTGVEFAVGIDQQQRVDLSRLADPMLGQQYRGAASPPARISPRMGDRILVLKSLYPFFEPKRFDVVVFKNPTDPVGDAQNYIKRLVGLPHEHIWLADGDVFAKRAGDEQFRIQRKPEHVQRAVWQPVHDSDFAPTNPDRLDQAYRGPPWIGDHWDLSGRRYRSNVPDATLTWDERRVQIGDWTPYNMLAVDKFGRPLDWTESSRSPDFKLRPVSDIRVSAAIVADREDLETMLELQTRQHIFQFEVRRDTAAMRMHQARDGALLEERTASIEPRAPGATYNVEFWHVDQAMRLFINGRQVVMPLEYDWAPLERLQLASGDANTADVDSLIDRDAIPIKIRWTFKNSRAVLHNVRVDRDLHYRVDRLDGQANRPTIDGHPFGTHPDDNAAVLLADQYMMCGDNSQMSLDSRRWGSPHPLVADQIDPAPFIVNRKLLLGKAWVVYFPAMFPLREGGTGVIPDFGRLRFIR